MPGGVGDQFDRLYQRFMTDHGDPVALRIQASDYLLDLEYAAMIRSGAVTAGEAERMKQRNMERVQRFYNASFSGNYRTPSECP